VKVILKFACGICHVQYDDIDRAQECEAEGLRPLSPVGMIFGRPQGRGHMYHDITFCVAKSWHDKHLNCSSLWACRDRMFNKTKEVGDTLGSEMCGPGPYGQQPSADEVPDPRHPTFKRMIKWLNENRPNIPITVWDGEKAVPLSKFRRAK